MLYYLHNVSNQPHFQQTKGTCFAAGGVQTPDGEMIPVKYKRTIRDERLCYSFRQATSNLGGDL